MKFFMEIPASKLNWIQKVLDACFEDLEIKLMPMEPEIRKAFDDGFKAGQESKTVEEFTKFEEGDLLINNETSNSCLLVKISNNHYEVLDLVTFGRYYGEFFTIEEKFKKAGNNVADKMPEFFPKQLPPS